MNPVGIKRLAEELSMSISTVSRALNGSPEASKATQQRVREAAARLGYVANQSGRSLRQGITGAIGFMVQTGSDLTGHGDTFFMSVFDGVQTVLSKHDLDLVALLCAASQDSQDYLRRMVSRGFVDGMIISYTRRIDPRIELLAERGLPFVTMGRSLSDAGQPWIDANLESMALKAVERLVAKGHSRIAISLPHDDLNVGHVLYDSVQGALSAFGLPLHPAYTFRSVQTESGGYEVARQLAALPERPTAIILSNEWQTGGLYRGLLESGCRPGRDIAVIGFASSGSSFLTPSLTGFRQSPREIGIDIGEALLSRMPRYAASYPDAGQRKLWELTLEEGESDALFIGPPIPRLGGNGDTLSHGERSRGPVTPPPRAGRLFRARER